MISQTSIQSSCSQSISTLWLIRLTRVIRRVFWCSTARCVSAPFHGYFLKKPRDCFGGMDVRRTFNPSGLPLPDDAEAEHPKVQELRALTQWSEGMLWVSPE